MAKTISGTYDQILIFVKHKGYKVTHRKLSGELAGYFDPDTTNIVIDRKLRGTTEGIYTLCHEYAHSIQHRYGTFKQFFLLDNTAQNTVANMELIQAAEQDAARQAKRMMKSYGIDYYPQELTKLGLELCKKFWKKHYFDQE